MIPRDSTHDFNTQSGGALRLPFLDSERRSESIFGIQSAPRFQAIYGVESVPRFQPIFGTQSAPRFQAIYGVESVPRFQPIFSIQSAPPLSSYILCLELHSKGALWMQNMGWKRGTLSTPYMTGLLHEGIFHVGGLIKPAIFGSSPWAYVICNWAQILICLRHWPTE